MRPEAPARLVRPGPGMRCPVLLAGLLLAFSPLPLRADALSDVRAALDRLSASTPLRARVETWKKETEKEKPKVPERRGTAIVEHGPSGLSVHLDPDQLPKPGTKADTKRREDATVRLDAAAALKLIDPASEIRQVLEGATVVSDRPEAFEGRTLRTVVLRPAADMDEEDRKAVKRYEDLVTLHLDAEGFPTAFDRTVDVKVSKMLLSFTVSHRESRRFVRVAGRLVTATATEESSGSGLGQSSGATTRWTVTPL